jgi:origin recognition complex subunit 3
MTSLGDLQEAYEEKQHDVSIAISLLPEPLTNRISQAAYIFDPSGDPDDTTHPTKRRRVSKKLKTSAVHGAKNLSSFQCLLQGAESEQSVKLRQEVFEKSWSVVDSRIQRILRDTNQSTLQQVTAFLRNATDHTPAGKIPSAFIITGPNIASQDLLFEQLSEALQHEADAPVVRLRSGDASNLRVILRKIIHDILSKDSADGDDLDVTVSKDVSSMIYVYVL